MVDGKEGTFPANYVTMNLDVELPRSMVEPAVGEIPFYTKDPEYPIPCSLFFLFLFCFGAVFASFNSSLLLLLVTS